MSVDAQHGIAYLGGLASLCVGVYLLAGLGAAMCVLGAVTMGVVIYARLRGDYDRRVD